MEAALKYLVVPLTFALDCTCVKMDLRTGARAGSQDSRMAPGRLTHLVVLNQGLGQRCPSCAVVVDPVVAALLRVQLDPATNGRRR